MKVILSFGMAALCLLTLTRCGDDDSPAPQNIEKQIISFQLLASENPSLTEDIVATIDESSKTISASLPASADLSDLTPTIEVSGGATVSPMGSQDFTSPVSYTVTAADGTETTYRASLKALSSSEKAILSFQFLLSENPIEVNAIGEVNESNHSVFIVLPGNTLQTALLPAIQVSPGATISPEGAQNFAEKVNYTVTAADGTSVVYEVTTVTEMDALKAIHYANPSNSLGWNTNDPDLANWDGVTLKNGAIIDLLIHNSGLNTIPPEIGYFKNLQSLRMHMNDFSSLPPEVGKLKGLKRLSVGLNGNLNEIPPEIGQLVTLESLFLDNNPSLTSLPAEIGQLTNLKALYINGNDLSGIPAEICALEVNYGTVIYKEPDITCD
ncbi:hypothetical protein GCM10009122_57040 [Fulvivirga kasyanovii]|uniref:DUF5018 domain-containing protein n=1 Tax=Fulvivirga kasyanovii TaxID=396812 RepID=A0ABW9RLG7_9BACT|nr:hypothetical protein [Fulvivirga kasyanovii]MTI24953.1 hypothetical protein [Fulvivirga kasyanovii]